MPKLTTTLDHPREYDVSDREALDLLRRGVVKTLDGKPVRNPEKAAASVAEGQKEN